MSPGGSYEDKMNSAPAATANGTGGGGGGITMSDVSRHANLLAALLPFSPFLLGRCAPPAKMVVILWSLQWTIIVSF